MAKLAKKHFARLNFALELQSTAQSAFPCVKAHLRLQLNVFSVDTPLVHAARSLGKDEEEEEEKLSHSEALSQMYAH